jgi:selenocysteine-specific elongation factor
MRSLVIGTAGHIDHGKTSLVKALTGVDTDRLKEEKQRGITIELGFARLDLGEGLEAGIVDVPGHERFVKNMVAGTSGIDMVLMVIAADEGVMPQTREHLDICNLLGIQHGVVALTKTDMVEDSEWVDMVTEEVRGELAGTFLEQSPIVPVSSRTREGIDTLVDTLRDAAAAIEDRASDAPAYLAIDRAFIMKGFGTVVTGTLVAGQFSIGDTVDILPDPARKMRTLKIRGLQVHGQDQEQVLAGHRLALNLANVERSALSRGQVVVQSDTLEAGREFEGTLELVPGAKPLRSRARVSFHAGTARAEATVTLIDRDSLAPGDKAYARFRCTDEVAALPGHRYILRGFSNIPGRGTTLGGGEILAVLPPRRRRKDKDRWVRELERLRNGTLDERLVILLGHADTAGLDVASLSMRSGFGTKTVRKELDGLMARREILKFDREKGRFIARSVLQTLAERARGMLTAYHQANPLLPGMPLEQVRSSLAHELDPRLFKLMVDEEQKENRLAQDGDVLRLATHRVQLDEDKTRLEKTVRKIYTDAPLTPPRLASVAQQAGEPEASILDLIKHLTRTGAFTHISGDMYVPTEALDDLRRRLVEYLTEHGEITTQDFKRMVGASRKHVIPLAEFFDREKTTIRRGETRVLRRKTPTPAGG